MADIEAIEKVHSVVSLVESMTRRYHRTEFSVHLMVVLERSCVAVKLTINDIFYGCKCHGSVELSQKLEGSRLTGDYNATSIGGDYVVDTYKQGHKK